MIKGFKVISADDMHVMYTANNAIYTVNIYVAKGRTRFDFDAHGHNPSKTQIDACKRALEVYTLAKKLKTQDIYCNISAIVASALDGYYMHGAKTPFDMDELDTQMQRYVCAECGETIDYPDTDCCQYCGETTDNPETEQVEIMEWYAVSAYLGNLLRQAGQIAVESDDNWMIYGRTCTGQDILLDGVLQDCAAIVLDRQGGN